METSPIFRPSLLRVLGPATAVAVTVGAVIGSGIFKKPQWVAQNVQSFDLAMLAWVLGGVLALLGALVVAELGAMLPKAGGSYVYLKEGFGPLWGFLWGWVEFWILRTGSLAALATIFSETLSSVLSTESPLGDWTQKALAAMAIAFLALINSAGVRWGGLVQNVTTCLKVASLLVIAALPFALGEATWSYLGEPGPAPGTGTLVGFGAAVLGVMWAYQGWIDLSSLGEELRNPQRDVPRGLIVGVGIVIFVYLAANLAYALVLPQSLMADPGRVQIVAVSFGQELFTKWGPEASVLAGKAVAAAIMISVLGALNANVLAGPRTYFALGRDGLFPSFLGKVHPQFRTPAAAILIQAVWAIALVLGAGLLADKDENPFDTLTNYSGPFSFKDWRWPRSSGSASFGRTWPGPIVVPAIRRFQ